MHEKKKRRFNWATHTLHEVTDDQPPTPPVTQEDEKMPDWPAPSALEMLVAGARDARWQCARISAGLVPLLKNYKMWADDQEKKGKIVKFSDDTPISYETAAELLGVTRRSIQNYVKEGRITAHQGITKKRWLRLGDVRDKLGAEF